MTSEWINTERVSWGESSPQVAKHVDITVAPAFRGLGVAQELQDFHLRELKKRQVRRVDAFILADNLASIRFHQKQGWSFVRASMGWIYICKEL